MSDKTFYITTPIYYPNDKLHIGHTYTTVAADALARYHRLRGRRTWFLTGTDEHGLNVERAARQAGKEPLEYVDPIVAWIKDLWATLDIQYDDFIRTTEERHKRTVQHFFQRLYDQGDIYKGAYKGLVLRQLRGVLHRGRAEGRPHLPGARAAGGMGGGGKLLLPPVQVRAAAVGPYRGEPGFRAARQPPQRGGTLHPAGPGGFVGVPHVVPLGHSGAV